MDSQSADLVSPVQVPTTSSTRPSTPPTTSIRGVVGALPSRPRRPSNSPTLSSSSTVDDSDSDQEDQLSPVIPSIPEPQLPLRARRHLRRHLRRSSSLPSQSCPSSSSHGIEDNSQYITTSWGSPYSRKHHQQLTRSNSSGSSEHFEDSPLHQLELDTPYLRPTPIVELDRLSQQPFQSLSESAAVLVNRARRLRGITEDWIRTHTTKGLAEPRHWLSDGESEHSSLASSQVDSGEERAESATPRASASKPHRQGSQQWRNQSLGFSTRRIRRQSSSETLKQSNMDTEKAGEDLTAQEAARIQRPDDTMSATSPVAEKQVAPLEDRSPGAAGSVNGRLVERQPPVTPPKHKKPVITQTGRLKKKLHWKGKHLVVHLPRDEERGQPGHGLIPLSPDKVEAIFWDWETYGYDTRGFDIEVPSGEAGFLGPREAYSQSRTEWPDMDDVHAERSRGKYQVALPDLNKWEDHVNELNEAKLRALGVSFGDEDLPPAPPVSERPAGSKRRDTIQQYPPLPFSSPISPLSAASASQQQGLQFPSSIHSSSAALSPNAPSMSSPFHGPLPGGMSPGSFSLHAPVGFVPTDHPYQLPGHSSPNGWQSPQSLLLQQQMARNRSPSLMNMHAGAPTSSPFQLEGSLSPFGAHQQHQSLQHAMSPYQQQQRQDAARVSPHLQDLPEFEEGQSENLLEDASPSKVTQSGLLIKHNSSASLQKEIDEAEYHLEKQFREQLEHEDYSPHSECDKAERNNELDPASIPLPSGATEPSVHFGDIGSDAEKGPVLHHPRPHSRGHSLTRKPFFDLDETRDSTDEGSIAPARQSPGDGVQQTGQSQESTADSGDAGSAVLDMGTEKHESAPRLTDKAWAGLRSSNAHSRQSSRASRLSVTKLNANAAEFKLKPTGSLIPAEFDFNGSSAAASQPLFGSLQATDPRTRASSVGRNRPHHSATESNLSLPTTTSSEFRVNAAAPVFAPTQDTGDFSFTGNGEFNFSAPAFNPLAPAFSTFGVQTSSVTAGQDGEPAGPGAIFSVTDMKQLVDVVKPQKESKAIPIIRPPSRQSLDARVPAAEEVDRHGREVDNSRLKKKFRGKVSDGDDVPKFAEPAPECQVAPRVPPTPAIVTGVVVAKAGVDDATAVGDTARASTVHSESTGTKATTSPSVSSLDHDKEAWTPCDLDGDGERQDFAMARSFGHDLFGKVDQEEIPAMSASSITPVFKLFHDPSAGQQKLPSVPVLKSQALPLDAGGEDTATERSASLTPGRERPPVEVARARRGRSPAKLPFPAGSAAPRFVLPPSATQDSASPSRAPHSTTMGLVAARNARSPSPVSDPEAADTAAKGADVTTLQSSSALVSLPVSPPLVSDDEKTEGAHREPTFEEIDEVMEHLNKNDPTKGVNRTISPMPLRNLVGVTDASLHLPPQLYFRSGSPSPSPLPDEQAEVLIPAGIEDPFADPPESVKSLSPLEVEQAQGHDVARDAPGSEWDDAFSGSEKDKLERRTGYFDGHVNELVDQVLASRLDPLERSLESIQNAMLLLTRKSPSHGPTPSPVRDRRSTSGELQDSDADDEDDEVSALRHSASPRKDKRMEQIRTVVMEAMNLHHATRALHTATIEPPEILTLGTQPDVVEALEVLKKQHIPKDELREMVEAAVENRILTAPKPVIKDGEAAKELSELHHLAVELEQKLKIESDKFEHEFTMRQGAEARSFELESRLQTESEKVETEYGLRRAAEARNSTLEQRLLVGLANVEDELALRRKAEDHAADLERNLHQAETKIEVEIMNRSIYDQRVHDLEDRLRHQEEQTALELSQRRQAEDKRSEMERLLRVSSEEEDRLRSMVEERDQNIKGAEYAAGQSMTHIALLEAAQINADKTTLDLTNRLTCVEEELRTTRQECQHWRSEAEHARDTLRRQNEEFVQATEECKHLRKVIDTLGTQLEENEKIRQTWRSKFASLQDDMAHAAREMNEETTKNTRKEQALLARLEVLEARLQAESCTRERLEAELERLEKGERTGLRAVSECKRLEEMLAELRSGNEILHQRGLHLQSEVQEARESAAVEVGRTRMSMQCDLEAANKQVNLVRAELEEDMIKLRSQLDQVRLEADTAKVHHEMMLEEAVSSKKYQLQELSSKFRNEIEDLQARYERQISNSSEDAQRSEQNLLERLSLSTTRAEHLQERVSNLEERLQLAQEAAKAAARAAKMAGVSQGSQASQEAITTSAPPQMAKAMQLPEKISPQALRESIMVLQEQLQAREQHIEELEQTVSKLDADAPIKISKRDDEITWLRELLAVRHGDLQDIIRALSAESVDREAVREAAIRLKANLQMEEQERERAMNGASAINLPNLAASIRGAASPRVSQAVGPLAAAWGNWRKSTQPTLNNLSAALSAPSPARRSTPSMLRPSPASRNAVLSGLVTPPTPEFKSTPLGADVDESAAQPTAFGQTGRRYTADEFASRARGTPLSMRHVEKPMSTETAASLPTEQRELMTSRMMGAMVYDEDARESEFDDAAFFDEV